MRCCLWYGIRLFVHRNVTYKFSSSSSKMNKTCWFMFLVSIALSAGFGSTPERNVKVETSNKPVICQFERSSCNTDSKGPCEILVSVHGIRSEAQVVSIVVNRQTVLSKNVDHLSCKVSDSDDNPCHTYYEGNETFIMINAQIFLNSICREKSGGRCDGHIPINLQAIIQRYGNASRADFAVECHDNSDGGHCDEATSVAALPPNPQGPDKLHSLQASISLGCHIRLRHRTFNHIGAAANFVEQWVAFFSAVGLPTNCEYRLRLLTSESVVLTRTLRRDECEEYEESSNVRLKFSGELVFRRTFNQLEGGGQGAPLLMFDVLPLSGAERVPSPNCQWEQAKQQLCEGEPAPSASGDSTRQYPRGAPSPTIGEPVGPVAPVLACQIRLLRRTLRPVEDGENSTDHWFAHFSAISFPAGRNYTLHLSSGAGGVLTRTLHEEDGEAYVEDGVPRLMFTGQLDFHRTFRPSSVEPPRPLLTLAVLPLPRDGGLQTWEPPTPQLCEVVSAQDFEEPSPAAEYRLEVLSPAGGVNLESGPIHVHYRLYPAYPMAPCKAVEVTVTAMVDGVLRAQVPAVCGKEATITISRVQRGQRALSLVATDATGRKLAEAGLIVMHPGPHPQEDPNAMCLLSYPHSGNHLTRFLIEYLTGRPTAGCYYNIKDAPIHTNTFPVVAPESSPLAHVDPLGQPVAYKFHYATSCGTMCALADVDRGAAFRTACRRLVLVIRDFSKCIPRYFEGIPSAANNAALALSDVDAQVDLYLSNVAEFSKFTGPKLLLHYEDLIAAPEAANRLAAFLGSEADPARTTALLNDYAALADLSRRAGGREWLGMRLPEAGGYLDSWQTKAVCRLAARYEAALRAATGEAHLVLNRYSNLTQNFLTICQ